MCTALTFKTRDFYFGRTLDLDFSYAEEVTVMPRCFPLYFRNVPQLNHHYAMIGMAHVVQDYPLYYDAVNEKGLAAAGLNFESFAAFWEPEPGKVNVAQYELIPWLLASCSTVREAREKLQDLVITNQPFSKELPPSPLHWILADSDEAITIESTGSGLAIHDNPVGILTNHPPFAEQLANLRAFLPGLDADGTKGPDPKNEGRGLPGALTSESRFVRCCYAKQNCCCGTSEGESVSQFFHMMDFVSQPKGCNLGKNGGPEYTVYTSCCNTDKGIYYYTTYNARTIHGISLRKEQLDASCLVRYPLTDHDEIIIENK